MLASLYMIGICISLVVKFRFELDCDDESMPTYSRRLIIQTFRGNGKKFIISRVCHSCIERFYKGSINSRETYFSLYNKSSYYLEFLLSSVYCMCILKFRIL